MVDSSLCYFIFRINYHDLQFTEGGLLNSLKETIFYRGLQKRKMEVLINTLTLTDYYYDTLSVDATIMVSNRRPITVE